METFNAHVLTNHALEQIGARGIPLRAVEATLILGSVFRVRGAKIHALGRKDLLRHEKSGIDDMAAYEGTQVVCTPDDKVVITVYRNRDFRGLRPRGRWMASARRRKRAIGVGN